MSRRSAKECHSQAFSARIEAVDALQGAGPDGGPDAARLRSASEELRLVSEQYGRAANAAQYAALAEAVSIMALLSEWRSAVLNAGVDAQRFLTAAKTRAEAWLTANSNSAALKGFATVLSGIDGLTRIDEVAGIARQISVIPLPIGIYTLPTMEMMRAEVGFPVGRRTDEESPPPIELAVAFLKFTIDGNAVNQVHHITPGETHDMDIEVRVTRWPAGATHLVLEPVSVEPPGTYHLPKFTLEAPGGEAGPFRLSARGRMALTVPNHILARPFEFKYTAHFAPSGAEQPVEVVGQRTLLLEGADLRRYPITGYPYIDRKLMDVRDTLRVVPHVDQRELADALTLAFALGNYAGQVAQDNLIPVPIDEDEFQRRLRTFLRTHPQIGRELEEHPHVAGGITDLSFRGIRLELKSEQDEQLTVSKCCKYVGQSVSYVAGSGKHIGVLCVLDCSVKTEPAFPAEDGITIFPLQHADGTPVYVITFLLQGNLTKPSRFSR